MEESTFVIKARGLPWSATAEEVVKFFSDVNIMNGENGVYFTFNKEGRPSGECFIEVSSESERDTALTHNNEHMGKRYIEIKEAKHSEMEWVVNRMQTGDSSAKGENIVRLRGLPFGCSRQDIDGFFEGLQIIPYGITITVDQDGRASGDAYVEFATSEDADTALGKHKEKIGHRYIEIFRSSRADIKHVVGQPRDPYNRPPFMNPRPGPYDRPNFSGPRRGGRGGLSNLGPSGFNTGGGGGYGGGYDGGRRGGGRGGPMRGGRSGGGMGGGMNNRPIVQNSKTGHSVHMRGLPFEATTNDVMQFFAPLNPVDIRFAHDPSTGRVKGECDVDFSTHNDAEAAMQKDKQNMGHRYIELFLKSTPGGTSMGGVGGGGGGWSNSTNDMGGGMPRRDAPAPLMGSQGGGGGYGGQSAVSGGGYNMGGGGGYDQNNSYGSGANYGGTTAVPAPATAGGGYGSFGGVTDTSGTGSYDNYKSVSYQNIQAGGGGNYYGNMR